MTRKSFYTVGKDDVSGTLTDYTLTPSTLSYYAVAIPDVEITASDGGDPAECIRIVLIDIH